MQLGLPIAIRQCVNKAVNLAELAFQIAQSVSHFGSSLALIGLPLVSNKGL
jgi:hypothetical protein